MAWKVVLLLPLSTVFGLVASPTKFSQLHDQSQRFEEGAEFGHGGHSLKFHRLEHRSEDGSVAPFNAIVIGANRGIGLETSRQLAKMGATVHLGCRDLKKCKEAANLINADKPLGSATVNLAVDMNSMASVAEYTKDIESTLSHIDLIVVSAGVNFYTRGKPYTSDGFETTMQVNYLGPFLLVEKLLPQMRRPASADGVATTPGGRVVLLSSDAHYPSKPVTPANVDPKENPEDGNYPLTKFLLIQLSQAINQRERKTNGVSALAVHPGMVDTDLMASLLHGDAVSGWMYKTVTCGALWLSGLYPDSPCPMTAEQGADTVLYAATDRTLVQRQDLGTTYIVPGHDDPRPLNPNSMVLASINAPKNFPEWTDKDRETLYSRSQQFVSQWTK